MSRKKRFQKDQTEVEDISKPKKKDSMREKPNIEVIRKRREIAERKEEEKYQREDHATRDYLRRPSLFDRIRENNGGLMGIPESSSLIEENVEVAGHQQKQNVEERFDIQQRQVATYKVFYDYDPTFIDLIMLIDPTDSYVDFTSEMSEKEKKNKVVIQIKKDENIRNCFADSALPKEIYNGVVIDSLVKDYERVKGHSSKPLDEYIELGSRLYLLSFYPERMSYADLNYLFPRDLGLEIDGVVDTLQQYDLIQIDHPEDGNEEDNRQTPACKK